MVSAGMCPDPDVIASRRRRAALLTRRGWYAREIAAELRVSLRTVQRYQRAERGRGWTGESSSRPRRTA
jgi:transposase